MLFCFFTVPGHSRLFVMWFLFVVVVVLVMIRMIIMVMVVVMIPVVVMVMLLLLVGLSRVLEGGWFIVRVTMTVVAVRQRGQREEQDEEEQTQSNRLLVGLLRDGNRCLALHSEVSWILVERHVVEWRRRWRSDNEFINKSPRLPAGTLFYKNISPTYPARLEHEFTGF